MQISQQRRQTEFFPIQHLMFLLKTQSAIHTEMGEIFQGFFHLIGISFQEVGAGIKYRQAHPTTDINAYGIRNHYIIRSKHSTDR